MARVHIDFETRSLASIKDVGTCKYAADESTEILCICYAVDNGPVQVVPREVFTEGNGFWLDLYNLAADENNIFVAHNAIFEQSVWGSIMSSRFGYPMIPIKRWRCTMAKASSHGLPKSLEQAAIELGSSKLKDMEGKRIMMKLSKPRKPTKNNPSIWNDDPEDYKTLYSYCVDDVETERALDQMLPDLNANEQHIWEIDQEMNLRGIPVDLKLVDKALVFAEKYSERLNNELKEITGGAVERVTLRDKFLKWLAAEGLEMSDFTEATVSKVYAARTDLPPHIRRALQIKLLLAKSSVKKYEAFKTATSVDRRLKDILTYHSASTGRWGGKKVQPQNLPRGVKGIDSDICAECICDLDFEDFEAIYPDVMGALSTCVRSAIKSEHGKELVVADFSAIEARGIGWLAGQEDLLDTFRRGECVYCREASQIYGYKCTKENNPYERQVGKTAILALGYQGGIAAFGTMANNYKLDLSPLFGTIYPTATDEEKAKAESAYEMYAKKATTVLPYEAGVSVDIIKQRWRKSNENIVKFWYEQEQGAIDAVVNRGKLVKAGKMYYQVVGDFLYCRLPSGRLLAYHRPEIKVTETEWGSEKAQLRYMTLDSQTKKYIRVASYGGKLAENITQAVCRDIMAEAMIRIYDTKRYELLITIHDEAVTQVEKGFGNVKELEQIMCINPNWCKDFPIEAAGWCGKRYKKD